MGLFDFNIFKSLNLPKSTPEQSEFDIRHLQAVLRTWLDSSTRKEQLLAEQYYVGNHDILRREKKVIGADGELKTINNVINNKLVDNQYRKLVDQKTNYILGKPINIATYDETYSELLNKVFSKKVHRQLRVLAEYSINGGIAWLHPYYNEEGEFRLAIFPSYDVCPLWKDNSHTELEGAMRYYPETVFDKNGGTNVVEHVDLFTKKGIEHFVYRGGSLIRKEKERSAYVTYGANEYTWDRLPIIPFKYNNKEIPLIRGVKCLQDALNQVLSDFQNNMEESPRTSILVLKNYDGTNAAEFRQNLATYGLIKVTTVDGVQGGVEPLHVEVNAQNYQAILMQLKRAIVENGRGFDAKEERMDGDPNQMNIESMYTDIDLDVNAIESEFQAGFDELKWFIDQYLKNQGEADYSEEEVDFIFNRDIFINEDAKIDNCVKSVGILSDETIRANHPWCTNEPHEAELVKKNKEEELAEMDATLKIQAKNTPQQPQQQKGSGRDD